jgi:hypothetical protein
MKKTILITISSIIIVSILAFAYSQFFIIGKASKKIEKDIFNFCEANASKEFQDQLYQEGVASYECKEITIIYKKYDVLGEGYKFCANFLTEDNLTYSIHGYFEVSLTKIKGYSNLYVVDSYTCSPAEY